MKLKSDGAEPTKFYGITKDPETKEFIIITEFANRESLRSILSHKILWKDKITFLYDLT